MYFLVLAAFLQLDTLAPKVYSKHSTLLECEQAAKSRTTENRDALDAEPELGLGFVCLKLMTV